MSKSIKYVVVAVVAIASLICLEKYWPLLSNQASIFFQEVGKSASTTALRNFERQILTPPPLRGGDESTKSTLTSAGVVKFTNKERTTAVENALTVNLKLTAAAKLKLDDMFKNQYFEHVSPSGKGPADLSDAVGYSYILIGENLALGNFKDDEALVAAWMASPGHRANILNNRFSEIGVAVGQGMYQGKMTWIAVQEFGEPLSDCPLPSSELKTQIDTLKQKVSSQHDDLQVKKKELDSMSKSDPAYSDKADAYNKEVDSYNNGLAQIERLIAQYNAQVRAFNECAHVS